VYRPQSPNQYIFKIGQLTHLKWFISEEVLKDSMILKELPKDLLGLELCFSYSTNVKNQRLNFPNLIHLKLHLCPENHKARIVSHWPIVKRDGKWVSRWPQLEHFIIKKPNTETIIDPDLFKSLPRLKKLTLNLSDLENVDSLWKGLSHLKDLETLIVSTNCLNDLNLNDLPPSLVELRVYQSRIETLEGDLSHMKNLRRPSLIKNEDDSLYDFTLPVRFLHGVLISCVRNLNYSTSLVDLNLSSISISELDESYFINLRQLRHLILRQNKLEKISSKAFKGLESLETLDLEYNEIREIDENAFSDLVRLKQLKLKSNYLVRIKSHSFSGLQNLGQLSLEINVIELIDSNAFKELSRLKFLSVQSNNLTMITADMFEGLTNLKELNLSFNQIEHIGPNFMQYLLNVEILDLSSNRIVKIETVMFTTSSNLHVLDLPDNQIREIERSSFKALKLKELNLKLNQLKEIHRSCFESLRVVAQVNIDRFTDEREFFAYSIYFSQQTSDWDKFLGQFTSE